jgi:hypothetical protein
MTPGSNQPWPTTDQETLVGFLLISYTDNELKISGFHDILM